MREKAYLPKLCAFAASMFPGLRICAQATSRAPDFTRTVARHAYRFAGPTPIRLPQLAYSARVPRAPPVLA